MAEKLEYTKIDSIVDERRIDNEVQFRVRWSEQLVKAETLDEFGGNLRSRYNKAKSIHAEVFARGYEDMDQWINHACLDSSRWRIVAVLGTQMKDNKVHYKVRWEDNWVDEDDVNDLAIEAWRKAQRRRNRK